MPIPFPFYFYLIDCILIVPAMHYYHPPIYDFCVRALKLKLSVSVFVSAFPFPSFFSFAF